MNIIFECSMPRTGSQLIKSVLKQNSDFAVQTDSPLHFKWHEFRKEIHREPNCSTLPKDELANRIKGFWLEGLKGWGKAINPKAKVYIEQNRFWADDIDIIKNFFNCKIIIILRDLKDIANSLEDIVKNHNEFNTQFNNFYTYKNSAQLQRVHKFFEEEMIRIPLTAIKRIVEEDMFNFVHFLKYEDFLKQPQKELDKLYKFLDLKSFKHDFNNINDMDRIDTPMLPYGRHNIVSSFNNYKETKFTLQNDVIDFLNTEFKWYNDRFYND